MVNTDKIIEDLKKEAEDLKDRKLQQKLTVTDEQIESVSPKTKGKSLHKDELIILAMGPTRQICPFDAETWGLNNGYRQVISLKGRLDKIFLAHKQTYYADDHTPIFDWTELNMCVAHGIDVINTHTVEGLHSRKYPFKRICNKFGTKFFSNTICYQLAYALDKATFIDKQGKPRLKEDAWKRIKIFGCDMVTYGEYQLEKGGVEFWCGIALGLGIDIEIAEGSTLCQTSTGKPYGEDYFNIKEIDPMGLLQKQAALERGISPEVINKLEPHQILALTKDIHEERNSN